jgi:hypothetical protein
MMKTENSNKKVTVKPVGKKALQTMLHPRLHSEIETQSVHHYGILCIATRLAHYIGTQLPSGRATLLEVILSQAISDWHAELDRSGIKTAFQCYCMAIFKSLPSILEYSVTGKTYVKPCYRYTWDCTSQSITDWLINSKIELSTLDVVRHNAASFTDPRDAAFLLCTKVFTRAELSLLGVVNEIHGLCQEAEE